MHLLPSSGAIWVCFTSRAAWDRHPSCHTAHLKGCCIFHTFSQGKLFSCVACRYLTADVKYRMLVSHPIWPFWKHPFSFFKEHNRSLIVKPSITNSSGGVPQATRGLTKRMSFVPPQHLTVASPKERANPEYTNAFYLIQDDLSSLPFHLCCTTTAALPSGFVLGGYFV